MWKRRCVRKCAQKGRGRVFGRCLALYLSHEHSWSKSSTVLYGIEHDCTSTCGPTAHVFSPLDIIDGFAVADQVICESPWPSCWLLQSESVIYVACNIVFLQLGILNILITRLHTNASHKLAESGHKA